jgi:hypothetical protein
MLLTYFLSDFEVVPAAPIITGITLALTFHTRCLLLLLLLLLLLVWIAEVPGSDLGRTAGSCELVFVSHTANNVR